MFEEEEEESEEEEPLPSSASAATTLPKAVSDALIALPSAATLPVVCALEARSEPARSTSASLAFAKVFVVEPSVEFFEEESGTFTVAIITACDLEDASFIPVEATTRALATEASTEETDEGEPRSTLQTAAPWRLTPPPSPSLLVPTVTAFVAAPPPFVDSRQRTLSQ